MSADLLREAAALMRERAEAATPGPWEHHRDHGGRETGDGELLIGNIGDSGGGRRAADFIGKCWGWGPQQPNAAHIASWHPAVALAVADWLDGEAGYVERHAASDLTTARALAVARTYLGRADA